jgi:hypothetical protein
MHLLNLYLSNLQPSFERNSKVHDGEEWVDTVLLLDQAVKDVLVAKHG